MSNGFSAASAQQCQANSTEYVIQKPCAGSNIMVQISKDEPTAFNFGVEDVRAMKLLADGALLITFTDGSTLTVSNFKEARENFKFEEITMSDGTVVNFDKLAQGLAGTVANDSVADLTILKPQGGIGATDLVFSLQEGKTYTLGFDMKEVAGVESRDGDLIVTFKDGSKLTLDNYDAVQAGVLPPQMTLADGSVVPVSQLINVLNVAAAEQVKAVEPAAGETAEAPKAPKVKQPEVAMKEQSAEDLAQIEPAAGQAAGPIGGTSGYGFNSSVDPAGINGLNAIGPIGPTSLQFGTPELQEFNSGPLPGGPAPAGTPVLSASDRFTFEDTQVNLLISATGSNPGSQTLTLTVTGIPAGWGVNLGTSGGTFNSGTGTWTITLPQGQSYSGGPFLIPPADKDGDIKLPTNPALTVTMTTVEVGTGTIETVSAPMNVVVDAVADQPDLAVNNVSGSDNVPLPLQISAAVVDTDGSETLTSVTLTGIPSGFTLNHGTLSAGVWTVNPADLPTLTLTPTAGYNGSFVVTVRVNNAETSLTDQEITLANNTNFNVEAFTVTINDTVPVVGDSSATVDDTSLSGGNNVVTGNVSINYQLDTPGTLTLLNTFAATGSMLGGQLSSNGNAVTVTRTADTFTGTANGVTIFTLTIGQNGAYTFTQFEQLDHANGSDPNDIITLSFPIRVTDSDGDIDNGFITIDVRDDAPVAANDTLTTANVVTGNVTSNDTLSQDTPNIVTQVVHNGTTYNVPANGTLTINGTYGTLMINKTGAFTYTSNNTASGTDNFTYTLRDYDGDTSTANLGITVNDVDTIPVVNNGSVNVDDTNLSGGPNVASGFISANYFADGPGVLTPTTTPVIEHGSLLNGILSSHGNPVTISLSGNTWTGTANGTTIFTLVVQPNGAYTFTQFEQLDHADGNDPNDMITLKFTVIGTDIDGDTDTGVISVHIYDDAPVAVNDTFTGITTGNITTNDNYGQDGAGQVYDVTFGGQTVLVPTNGNNVTITNASGTLVINKTGVFTYTPPVPGQDTTFTYRIVDFDGDKSIANAQNGTVVIDLDGTPTITGSSVTTDDTNLFGGPQTVNGTYTFSFGPDGQGAGGISNTGYTGPALTSNGNAINVTLAGNTYTGTANGVTVFTMTVNTNGTYSFTQFEQLDHPNVNDPNDALNLTFGVRITDADGDIANGTLTAVVRDDGPVAVNDSFTGSTPTVATGNVTTNDNYGQDGAGSVVEVTFGGQTVAVPTNGTNVTVTNAAGTLVINNTGAFTYTAPAPGVDGGFTYRIVDFDGDKSAAGAGIDNGVVTITMDDVPVITGSSVTTDDTNLVGGPQTVNGTYTFNYGGDGQGTGGILATGYTGPALTSNGVAVTITQPIAGQFVGTANGVTIFTMTINNNGTYSFTQFEQLDHPNVNDPNDALNLTFGLRITDADGDFANATLTAVVRDDGPVAVNDSFAGSTPTIATGNVLTNDNFGQDGAGSLVEVTFGGQTVAVPTNGTNATITNAAGTLVINNTGAFTYTAPAPGVDGGFTYRIVDFDGDKSAAGAGLNNGVVTITMDDVPVITGSSVTTDDTNLSGGPQTVAGTYTFNYGGDGQGAGGISNTGYTGPALTSNGQPVTVTLAGNTYTGTANGVTVFTMTVNSNGTYSFTQFEQLDHPNVNDPNDALNLTFGIRITDADGDIANATLTAVVRDDGPVAVNDSFLSSTATASGNITANDNYGQDGAGQVYDVTFGGQTAVLPSNGTNVTITNAAGTLVINSTGQFTFTPPLPGQGATFTYRLVDFDGDKSVVSAQNGTVTIDTDGTPIIGDAVVVTDETTLVSGPAVTTGSISSNFFGDGPGTIAPLNQFTPGGSMAGGSLKSGGVPVTVTLSGSTYTGTANGVTIFTLVVNNNGTFTFTQFEQLDHANGSDPNDIITLNFTVRGTDADGDTDDGTITVNVRDDAPSALNDTVNLVGNSATGNVLTNDIAGQDTPVPVLSVLYNGTTFNLPQNGTNVTITAANGTLVINSTGAYTYTSNNTSTGTDVFNYTIRDYDGDTSSANLSVTVTDVDTVPVVDNSFITVDETNLGPISLSGQVNANYFGDGPGSIMALNQFTAGGSLAGGTLKSNGVPVTVTLSGNTYTGTAGGTTIFTLVVNANGSYTYTQFEQMDHADANNPNDVITLNFVVQGTDADGDTDTGVITVNVLDDAPVAVNDTLSVSSTTPATGNLLTNDDVGEDTPGCITQIVLNGVTYNVPANGTNVTVNGVYGTLVINKTGAYTYTSNNTNVGSDTFTYTLRDFDNDPSTATFTATVNDVNTTPVVTNTQTNIDESGSHTVTGTINANFFGDGPGTFLICAGNTMTAGGSLKNGTLSSSGYAVNVTLSGNTYTGTANGQTVFTLTLAANGSYTFTQFKPLDHANTSDPNDVINLAFQVCARDADGDVGHGTITINVIDDAPVAVSDNTIFCHSDFLHNGNLLTGFHNTSGGVDSLSFDTPNWVFAVSGAGGTGYIPVDGVAAIQGNYGTLYVFNNGSYFYNQAVAGSHTENFTYYLQDGDGDTAAGTLTVTGVSSYINSSWIIVNGSANGSNSGDMMVAYTANVADTMYGNGGDDAMFGWSGNDSLVGGSGNDALFGEQGADNLWGGSGTDVFVTDRNDLGTTYDTVHDFNANEGDVIDLSALIDNGSAAQSAINSYVRALNTGSDTLLQVNNGSGWQDAILIKNHTNLNVQTLLNDGNLDVT
ncbi:MAG: type I secretion C-terminal target domain-containing protein [Proteobacteria bacterium]|nr:type I secretion C-terminal target domain-containing protein [Pseudomonadota bacterium]